jgi:hypothetical protein
LKRVATSGLFNFLLCAQFMIEGISVTFCRPKFDLAFVHKSAKLQSPLVGGRQFHLYHA